MPERPSQEQLANALRAARKQQELLAGAAKKLSELSSEMDRIICAAEEEDRRFGGLNERYIDQIDEQTERLMMPLAYAFYKAAQRPPRAELQYDRQTILEEKSCEIAEKFGIEVRLKDCIYVKLPMLWQRKKIRTGNPRADFEHTDLFAAELDSAVRNHPNFQDYDWQSYAQKTVQILYVYSRDSVRLACDNDARDVKAIMDCLTGFMPGGDSAFSCSLHESSAVTDRIEQGTYITIITGKQMIMPEEKVISEWCRA